MSFVNKVFISGVLIAVLSSTGAGNSFAEEKPNIVFIISDDHDNEHLGFMGSKTAQTPNLDRLARPGTVFPVCLLYTSPRPRD